MAEQPTHLDAQTAPLGFEEEQISHHAHVAYFWETDEEFADAVAFLAVGLQGKDHCVIFGHEEANQTVCEILAERGFDIKALQAQRRLSLLGGSSSGDEILNSIANIFEQAIAEGAQLVRLLGNIGWFKENWPSEDDLLVFEAKVTEATKHFPCVVVCMYDIRALPGAVVHHGGFETHPLILRDHSVRENPYHVPTDIFLEHLESVAASIAERRRADQELKKSEERFRTLFESSPIGISINNWKGEFLHVNRSFQEMLEYTLDELRNMSFREITFPDDLPESKKLFGELVEGKRNVFQTEKRYCKKGGGILMANTSCSAVRDSNGEFAYTFAMVIDITEKKLAEEALRRALSEVEKLKNKLQAENIYLQEEIKTQHNFEDIVGNSSGIRKVFRDIEKVANTDSTVLIIGETGTGKELVARAIHSVSSRRNRALITINCAALPAGLIESELFGHEKGAFTGAITRKKGRFELADSGSIFLDEIGELTLETQIKLMRILQEHEFQRIGGSETLKVDVRVIAATNRDLDAAVKAGAFRSDLFYRLNIFPIHLPPLRERQEDIPLLTNSFVSKFSRKIGKKIDQVSANALEWLMQYSWPGNVRELANVLERAVILCDGGTLEKDHLGLIYDEPAQAPSNPTLKEAERLHILKALEKTNWVVGGPSGAAKLLGMNRTTLIARMKRLGIEN